VYAWGLRLKEGNLYICKFDLIWNFHRSPSLEFRCLGVKNNLVYDLEANVISRKPKPECIKLWKLMRDDNQVDCSTK
jgi:hypothetical protein